MKKVIIIIIFAVIVGIIFGSCTSPRGYSVVEIERVLWTSEDEYFEIEFRTGNRLENSASLEFGVLSVRHKKQEPKSFEINGIKGVFEEHPLTGIFVADIEKSIVPEVFKINGRKLQLQKVTEVNENFVRLAFKKVKAPVAAQVRIGILSKELVLVHFIDSYRIVFCIESKEILAMM